VGSSGVIVVTNLVLTYLQAGQYHKFK